MTVGLSAVSLQLLSGTLGGDAAEPAVAELAFRLERGSLDDLLRLAERWVQRHAVWLDVRSAADRAGDGPPRSAAPVYPAAVPALSRQMDADAALRVMVAAILQQLLPNVAVLTAGRGAAEHVHQVRVALRRLRTVLNGFGSWTGAVQPAWSPALARLFRQLNSARDHDVLTALLPQLQNAGGPRLTLPPPEDRADATSVLRGRDCTRLMLQLIGFAFGPARTDLACGGRIERLATRRLSRWHRRLCADARVYGGLGDADRHDVRKRLKRLRYGVEAVKAVLPPRSTARYLAQLRDAQDVLGELSDTQVAQMHFIGRCASDTGAAFALGWLAARRAQLVPAATGALQRLPRQPKPLRR